MVISTEYAASATDVTVCEACWREPVQAARTTHRDRGRDLVCIPCAQAGCPARVELFPPLGIYGLNGRKLGMGKRGSPGGPRLPPGPGPPLPSPPPTPAPGRPPAQGPFPRVRRVWG
ncbi:hypothetical protein [Streptomyces sp. NPDC047014]|uniref:hypothetical protein n=1 Tax=Streptomyces sp. NPDC047014 TaxID=3155736 RepID=UPI0033FFC753